MVYGVWQTQFFLQCLYTSFHEAKSNHIGFDEIATTLLCPDGKQV